MKHYLLKQRDVLQKGDEYQISTSLKIFLPVPLEFIGQKKSKFVGCKAKVRRAL